MHSDVYIFSPPVLSQQLFFRRTNYGASSPATTSLGGLRFVPNLRTHDVQ